LKVWPGGAVIWAMPMMAIGIKEMSNPRKYTFLGTLLKKNNLAP